MRTIEQSTTPAGPERDAGEKAHLEAARDQTIALLREATGADPHEHGSE